MSTYYNPDDTAPTGATISWLVIIHAILLICLIGGLIAWTAGRREIVSTDSQAVTTSAEEPQQRLILLTGGKKP